MTSIKKIGSGANKGRCVSLISQSDHILAHLLINYLCCCLYGKALICVLSGISCTAESVRHTPSGYIRERYTSSWGKGRTTLYVNTSCESMKCLCHHVTKEKYVNFIFHSFTEFLCLFLPNTVRFGC